jgi:hypothetical protein
VETRIKSPTSFRQFWNKKKMGEMKMSCHICQQQQCKIAPSINKNQTPTDSKRLINHFHYLYVAASSVASAVGILHGHNLVAISLLKEKK